MEATNLIMDAEPLMHFLNLFLTVSAIIGIIIFVGNKFFEYLKAYRKREAILNIQYEYEKNGEKIISKEIKRVTILYFPPPRLQKDCFFVKIKDEEGKVIYCNSKIIKKIEFL